MKSIAMQSPVHSNEEIKHQLSQEVNETLATTANVNNTQRKKIFTAVELWHSRRNVRSASSRIHRRITK